MRRFLLALLAFLVLLAGAPVSRAETEYMGGDIDSDGAASAQDAAIVLRAAAGLISLNNAESARADVTGSQTVTSADATAILLLAAGRIDAFSDVVHAVTDGLLGDRYLDRFAYRGTVRQGTSYRSAFLSIDVRQIEYEGAICYIADVYMQNITSFRTAFSSGEFMGARQEILGIARDSKAVLALNGDLYTYRTRGPLVRNGKWYRTNIDRGLDVCVLYQNGEMKTYPAGTVSELEIRHGEPYQTWVFGPCLLDENGGAMKEFRCDSSILNAAARSAIGYYEPGHYVLVAADSKANPASKGLTMAGLSRLFATLGCKAAYNLYGGQSSALVASGEILTFESAPRTISDILCIAEPLTGESGS